MTDATRSTSKNLGHGCTNSFASGTEVLMGDGSRLPIEQIEVGQRVLAYDPVSAQQQARIVTNTITASGQRELIDVTFELGNPVVSSKKGTLAPVTGKATVSWSRKRATQMIARPIASR